MNDANLAPSHEKPKLLDRVRAAICSRHYSRRTEDAYVHWIRRFIFFHGKRHPPSLPSTQNQALSALLFLYRQVLQHPLPWLDNIVPAKRPVRLPVVLSRDEVQAILAHLHGTPHLMATLLYGAGLRVLECCRLRVKDVDFGSNEVIVREGKGDKDRVTLLPHSAKVDLARHLEMVRSQHQRDLERSAGWVELPMALGRKYPNAGRELPWQWVFPATRFYIHRETGQRRRHHLHESVLQKAALLPYASPLFRDSPARGWVRHPHGTRAAGPHRRQYDDDLHPCPQPRTERGPQSSRSSCPAGRTDGSRDLGGGPPADAAPWS